MDISDFEIVVTALEEKVLHADPSTGEPTEANEMKITWKHNTLNVSEQSFYLREDPVAWQDKLNMREQDILNMWLEELGYDKKYYRVQDKKIVAIGKIEDDTQVQNWLKPNGMQIIEPKNAETI